MAKTTQLAMMVRRTVYLEISMNQKILHDLEKLYRLGLSQIMMPAGLVCNPTLLNL